MDPRPPSPDEPADSVGESGTLREALADVLDEASGDRLEEQTTLASLEAKMFGTGGPVRVGRYELGERLGRGAMGDVHVARDPSLDRSVAIKLLRPGPPEGGARGRKRFVREAQSIAALSHPHVVKVFDVGDFDWSDLPGWTGEGDPRGVFIVMERIDGQDLHRWLTEREHPWTEILARFRQAGEGLAAAHRSGIIHRDFKPSNVLVSKSGTVKVVDFGLALLSGTASTQGPQESVTGPSTGSVDSRQTPNNPQCHATGVPRRTTEGRREAVAHSDPTSAKITQTGTVLGTPLYMAPEQHRGQPADARADQFAFCASLFTALHRSPPYSGKSLGSLLHAKESGPPRPPAGSPIPRSIERAIARGLSPDADDRWPSMERLLAALQPPALKTGPWLFAGLGAVGVAMVALLAAGERRTDRCEPEPRLRQVWNTERQHTLGQTIEQTALPYAATTVQRLTRTFEQHAEQWGAEYRAVCEDSSLEPNARDLRMLCLLRQLEEFDAMLDVLGEADPQVLERATSAAAALPTVQQCLDTGYVGAVVQPPTDPSIAGDVEQLRERLVELRTLERLGRYRAGLVMAKGVAAEAERLEHPPLTVDALLQLGTLQDHAGDYRAAIETLERAFFAAQPLPYPTASATAALTLVYVHGHRVRDYDRAEQWGRHATAALEALGSPPLLEAELLDNLAAVDVDRGDYTQALARNERAQALLGANGPPLRRATSHNNVATSLDYLGRHEQALTEYAKALELRRETLGPQHPAIATVLYNMGNSQRKAGQVDEALATHQEALAIREQTLGPAHPRTGQSLTNVAAMLTQQGQLPQALNMTQRALAIWEATYESDHPYIVGTTANLAELHDRQGDAEGALVTYAKLVPMARDLDEPNPALLLHVLARYGALLSERGDHPAAIAHLEEGLAVHARTPGPPATIGAIELSLSRSLVASGGDETRARSLADDAIEQLTAAKTDGAELLPHAQQWRQTLKSAP